MNEFYQRVQQDEDPIKRLARRIPGFGGYIERQSRRDADKLLRETVAERMAEQWRRLTDLQRRLAEQGQLRYLDDLEGVAVRLRTFVDQVRTASYGYSGFFDAVKVNEEDLARLYAFDQALLDLVDAVTQALNELEANLGSETMPDALRRLAELARQCVETFYRREEVLTSGQANA